MNPGMVVVGWSFVAVLAGLGLFVGSRQIALLRRPAGEGVPPETVAHFRGQAVRRLVMSAMLLVLGGLLAGMLLSGMPERLQEIADAARQQQAAGKQPQLDPDQSAYLLFASAYLLVAVVLLLSVIVVAGLDLWAIRAYELREMRRLREDRREMIERELSTYRTLRNGQRH